MESATHYWYYLEKIPKDICQKIIDLGKDKWEPGSTLGEKFKNRKNEVYWTTEQWLYDLIWPYMVMANEQSGWNYDIVSSESLQIAKYDKKGHYNWHSDGLGSHKETFNEPDSNFLHGNVRKLSMSLVLNSDFEGGNFKLFGWDDKMPKLSQGSIIFFPSFLMHRVTPVKQGTRYSLISWFLGPPFK